MRAARPTPRRAHLSRHQLSGRRARHLEGDRAHSRLTPRSRCERRSGSRPKPSDWKRQDVPDPGDLVGAGPDPPRARRRPVSVTRLWARRLDTSELWALRCDAREPAREELMRRFLPLARNLALRYRRGGEPSEDLVQVANLGLLGAVDRFDPDRGTTFLSYAIPTVLGELRRYFRDAGWAVRVPRSAQELAMRVEQTSQEMADCLGRLPRVDEVAQCMNLGIDDVLDALALQGATAGPTADARPGQRGRDGHRGRRQAQTGGPPTRWRRLHCS
jgi:RNA polymerase sigma factor (sigma-70 family)